jgi:ribosomal protein S18 acetylase RimI-like enzyme
MIKVKQLKNLSKTEINQLSQLTNHAEDGGDSYMLFEQLQNHKEHPLTYVVQYVKNKKTLGWATVEEKWNAHAFYCAYVSPKYRRKGIGSKLLTKAKSIAETRFANVVSNPMAWPWDVKGKAFYRKNFGEKIRTI